MMLSSLLCLCLASSTLLFPLSAAQCSTYPFCDKYPECFRSCIGAREDRNNWAFWHSYGTDMAKICSTGDALVNHYGGIFDCISANCTTSAEGQTAWNQLVDDCWSAGYDISTNSTLKPLIYSTHGQCPPLVLLFLPAGSKAEPFLPPYSWLTVTSLFVVPEALSTASLSSAVASTQTLKITSSITSSSTTTSQPSAKPSTTGASQSEGRGLKLSEIVGIAISLASVV